MMMNVKLDYCGERNQLGSCARLRLDLHHRRHQRSSINSGRNGEKRGPDRSLRVQAFQLFQRSNARYLIESFLIKYPSSNVRSQLLISYIFHYDLRRNELASARNELLNCIAQDDPAKSARISQLIDILISPENRPPPFTKKQEQLLGGGPWQVVYTRGAFLWQVYTSPGKLVTGSSNRAAQDFNPYTRAVLNIGEIFGPAVQVSAVGSYTPTNSNTTLPKEIDVTITGGEINAWGNRIALPIKGKGKFFITYLDDTIRIFKSTGGGITVQIREDKLAKLRRRT
jgi:hypothetical protein